MGQILIFTCDNCEKKIDGEPNFAVAWNENTPLFLGMSVPNPNWKIFCTFDCLSKFVNAEYQRRQEIR